MIDGSVDVRNLRVGDKISDDGECVATIKIAAIKCKASDELAFFLDLNRSKGLKFHDIMRAIDAIRDRVARMEPVIVEGEKAVEYLEKTGFKPDDNAIKNSRYVKALKEKLEGEGKQQDFKSG